MTLSAEKTHWQATLRLTYEASASRTVISQRDHVGPLVVQRPFYPEGSPCHTYILHPPGGVVAGDQLSIHIHTTSNAHALITTPAANKFYRSTGALAQIEQWLNVEDETTLEWLPQESIYFQACNVAASTRVQLAQKAKFIGWEITCLGTPAGGQHFDQGTLRQKFELWQADKPLFIDRALLQGGSEILTATWGLQGYSVLGTLLIYPGDQSQLEAIHTLYDKNAAYLFSASLINKVIVCRCLGHGGEQVKQIFIRVWSIIRPLLIDKPVSIPRIWNT